MNEGIVSTECELSVEGYEIVHPIGSGGMGQVFLARQQPLGRLVALKILTLEQGGASEERITRFRREAELMASLSHPNVLPVFQYGETIGRPFLVLEYIADGDLRRFMPEGRPMTADAAMAILEPVAQALAYLHSRGILHRDLKPENILMHEGKVPKVADFGVAVSLLGSGSLTKTGHRIGTLGYVAPEQHYQLEVDERADQFSLAALAYEMFTGQRPLGILKPPSSHNPKLGPAVDKVILQGLQEVPGDRFRSVLEFVMALGASLSDHAPGVPATAFNKPPYLAAGLIAVPLVFLGFWLARPPGPPFGFPGGPFDPRNPPGFPPPDRVIRGERDRREDHEPVAATPEVVLAANPISEEEHAKTLHDLTRLRSVSIWKGQGRPLLPRQATRKNWMDAEGQIKEEVVVRAYRVWENKGGVRGKAGEEMRHQNEKEAARELLREAKEKDASVKH